MDMYLHDSAMSFRFVLRGDFTAAGVQQVRWAWQTARSTLDGKEVTVEVSGVTKTDQAGVALLRDMRASGARIIAARPPECEDLIPLFDLSAAQHELRARAARLPRIMKAVRSVLS